jgi:hypothetical protein
MEAKNLTSYWPLYEITQYEFPLFPAVSSSTISNGISDCVEALTSFGADEGAAAVLEEARENKVKKLSISR